MHDPSARGYWGSATRPVRFTLEKETRYPLYRMLGGLRGRTGGIYDFGHNEVWSSVRLFLNESLYRLRYPGRLHLRVVQQLIKWLKYIFVYLSNSETWWDVNAVRLEYKDPPTVLYSCLTLPSVTGGLFFCGIFGHASCNYKLTSTSGLRSSNDWSAISSLLFIIHWFVHIYFSKCTVFVFNQI